MEASAVMEIVLVLLLILVAAVGAGGAVWIVGQRTKTPLQEELAAKSAELASLQNALSERDAALRTASEAREKLANIEGRLDAARRDTEDLAKTRQKILELETQNASLRTAMQASEQAHTEQVQALSQIKTEIETQFELLAGRALEKNSAGFLQEATQVFESQKNTADGKIADLVKPLGESLKKYEEAVLEIERARMNSYGNITSELSILRGQLDQGRSVTEKLVNALQAAPKVRGRWAEKSLKRVMEMCGMLERCDFDTEKTFKGEETLRPDAVVHIAGGRNFVVDAKAPISAFFDAVNATDEESRRLHLIKHAAQFRERMKNLSSKAYWECLQGSPDCVVMFVPGDTILMAALEHDPNLYDEALSKRVLMATPTLFFALAQALSYGWRQEALAQNALHVAELGKELFKRLRTFGDRVASLGNGLDRAVKDYNLMVGSLENSVMPQARRFKELGVDGTADGISEISEVDRAVKLPSPGRDLQLTDSSTDESPTIGTLI